MIKRFLEAYGKDMEFCQLQLNYLDWTFQDAKAKVELLSEYGIPVWVMEPLRGGKLASLSDQNTQKLKALRPDEGYSGVGIPFPAVPAGSQGCPVRYVQHGTAQGQYSYI